MSVGGGHDAIDPELEPEEPSPPGKRWKLAIVGLIGVFIVLACYAVISGRITSNGTAAASSTASTVPARTSAASSAATSAQTPGPAPSSASSPQAHPLTVASVAAFGPDGTSDGDNPVAAARIVSGGGGQPWYSSWYASADFGNLQAGTGILLDMGQTVTVSSVRLVLGDAPGANVQVRVGNGDDPADLAAVVADVSDVGGTVQLPVTSPASGRYVLIWFTRLPPVSDGHYQVSVYSATVDGTVGA